MIDAMIFQMRVDWFLRYFYAQMHNQTNKIKHVLKNQFDFPGSFLQIPRALFVTIFIWFVLLAYDCKATDNSN
jgi:hypothetical protein